MKKLFAQYLVATGQIPEDVMKSLKDFSWSSNDSIGRLALMHGLLNPMSIDAILADQRRTDELFGQIAIRLRLLNHSQIELLVIGQAMRACTEMIEDLALAGILPMRSGVTALSGFITSADFCVEALEKHHLQARV